MKTQRPPSYRLIREQFQTRNGLEEILVDHYAKVISPIFTRMLVAASVTPNSVTILMMVLGVLGAIAFAIPSLWGKILGLILIHLWYILDCSDGEDARITRQFSKFGAELDFTAHVVCHPLFNLAFAAALIGLGRYSPAEVLLICLLIISGELMLRNYVAFQHIFELKIQRSISSSEKPFWKRPIIVLLNAFSMYPNFALVFPIVYLIDMRFGTSIAFGYLCIQTAITCLVALRTTFKWVAAVRAL